MRPLINLRLQKVDSDQEKNRQKQRKNRVKKERKVSKPLKSEFFGKNFSIFN